MHAFFSAPLVEQRRKEFFDNSIFFRSKTNALKSMLRLKIQKISGDLGEGIFTSLTIEISICFFTSNNISICDMESEKRES